MNIPSSTRFEETKEDYSNKQPDHDEIFADDESQ